MTNLFLAKTRSEAYGLPNWQYAQVQQNRICKLLFLTSCKSTSRFRCESRITAREAPALFEMAATTQPTVLHIVHFFVCGQSIDLLHACVWLFIWERERKLTCRQFHACWNWTKIWPNNFFLKNISAQSEMGYFESPVNQMFNFLSQWSRHFTKKNFSKKRVDSCIMEIEVFSFTKFIFLPNICVQNSVLRPVAQWI